MSFWAAAAPILGSVAGSILGGSSDTEATTSTVPWAGIQPYMTGTDPVPSYMSHTPQVSDIWNSWADNLRNGGENSWLQSAPPMWQGQGGEPTWNPYAQLQQAQPQPPQLQAPQINPNYNNTNPDRIGNIGYYDVPDWDMYRRDER